MSLNTFFIKQIIKLLYATRFYDAMTKKCGVKMVYKTDTICTPKNHSVGRIEGVRIKKMKICALFFLLAAAAAGPLVDSDAHVAAQPVVQESCNLSKEVVKEIAGYSSVVQKIFDEAQKGSFKGKTYKELATFVDHFQGRLSGTKNLEDAIDYMVKYLKKKNVTVTTENAPVPDWERGVEKATLVKPIKKNLKILGLGHSIGTPKDGLTAEVLVVKTFKELETKSAKAKGKIVVFNQDYADNSSVQGDYGQTVVYRSTGPVAAAKVGALAALVRSVGGFSIYSPHGGYLTYQENVTKIPGASITVEDAELLYRLQQAGKKITITLKMDDGNHAWKTSRNTIATIEGKEKKDEIVIVSGHIDSWDNTQGAMDDGGGMMIAAHTAALLTKLGLKPKRTLRTILWTAEELGFWGVKSYIKEHKNELAKHTAVIESDIGTWKPTGLDYAGSAKGACVMQEVVKLLGPMKANKFRKLSRGEVGSDIIFLANENIPSVSLNTVNSRYFWFHHTEGDTMALENSQELDQCLGVYAAAAYVIADMSPELPREEKFSPIMIEPRQI